MRTSRWLRFGLTSLMIGSAAMAAALVACSDDDENPGTPTPSNDSGTDSSQQTTEDSGTDAAKPPKKEPAKLQLVNAATDLNVPDDTANPLGGLRFCYQLGANVYAPLPALPDAVPGLPYPGVPVGTGGPVAATGADLSAIAITPVIINAKALADRGLVKGDAGTAGQTCGEILGTDKDAGGQGPLVENRDYWVLETIPAQSLLADKSYALVLTGCPSNTELAEADRPKCGPDFTYNAAPGKGNLKVQRFELDRATAIDAAKIGTQFIHASAPGAAALALSGTKVIPGYIETDGGTKKPIVEGDAGVAFATVTPLVQVDGVTPASYSFTANVDAPNFGYTLAQIEELSAVAPGTYKNGAAFTFIAVGDPTASPTAGGQFNLRFFHYLGVPNDPVIGVYK